MTASPFEAIAAQVAALPFAAAGATPREPRGDAGGGEPSHPLDDGTLGDATDDAAAVGPSDANDGDLYDGTVNPDLVRGCAGLDHSDTDNGRRLLAHFGDDLRVMRLADAKSPSYVVWAGAHWDADNGTLLSHAVAQKVGARIGLEAEFLEPTPFEAETCAAADRALATLGDFERKPQLTEAEKRIVRDLGAEIRAGEAAGDALERRQTARRKFAVSSKNKARIEAMLVCAAPHCALDPDDFNADPFVLGTAAHTIRFAQAPPRPDDRGLRPTTMEVRDGHERADLLTRLVPVRYDPDADCPKWRAFLEEMMPSASLRQFLQDFSGIGLLGRTVQMIVFHFGSGANGKSVFLETLMRVLGPLGTGLPAESVTGMGERGAGGAAPDLARLYGARTVRILELPADKPLHEDLVKKLTGGEKIPVRTLFKGYFEFTPVFTAHMSGNGYPKVDGTDNGIWRRLKVVHWPVELPEDRQRPFDDVLADFAPEYPGILNWLIDGALRFLERGLEVPREVTDATDEYRSAMDPIRDFVADCVERVEREDEDGRFVPDEAAGVSAREMFKAYTAWCEANALRPFTETRFGRDMRKKFRRLDERIRRYVGCRLHDVPSRMGGDARDDGWPEER